VPGTSLKDHLLFLPFQQGKQHSFKGKILHANYGLATLLQQVLMLTEEFSIDLGSYLR
jgi:hypothetical protein